MNNNIGGEAKVKLSDKGINGLSSGERSIKLDKSVSSVGSSNVEELVENSKENDDSSQSQSLSQKQSQTESQSQNVVNKQFDERVTTVEAEGLQSMGATMCVWGSISKSVSDISFLLESREKCKHNLHHCTHSV